jgi:hypothetical protein
MPKRPPRDKRTVRPGASPRSVGDLIATRLPALAKRAPLAEDGSEWHVAVMNALGSDLAKRVIRCTLVGGRLKVMAESSAWAARLRYALADLEPRLRQIVPGYQATEVRIRPAHTAAPRR